MISKKDIAPSKDAEFELIKFLGKGHSSKVATCKDTKTGIIYAMKYIIGYKECHTDEKLYEEFENMKDLDHPNIIKAYMVAKQYYSQHDCIEKKGALILEYAPNFTLFHYLKGATYFPEHIARRIFLQILDAIQYLHAKNIGHRDVKVKNFVFDEKFNVKLCDFGSSGVFDDLEKKMFKDLGKIGRYRLPDLKKKTPYPGPELDLYQAGVTLFFMVVGTEPPGKTDLSHKVFVETPKEFWKDVRKESPNKSISSEFVSLMSTMLNVNEKFRANFTEVKNHPWTSQKLCLVETYETYFKGVEPVKPKK